LAFKWLDEHRPTASNRTAVVHGDFRLGNVIVDASGLRAVIDWELAHLGDPIEDLGWMCVPAWRFGSRLPAAGVGTREQLLAAYAEQSGVDVDPETLRWWEVSGILRWGMICVTQAFTHTSGIVRSHELAAIGRRVCENEHDLFLALEGRW
jgi:aminoglycoside phosphotransferase (APT) family kinase protein